MTWRTFPTDYDVEIPQGVDLVRFSDDSDWNISKAGRITEITKAWLNSNDSDELPEGNNNLYLQPTERVKLQSIETWAQVNQVNSVQWEQWNITLTLDEIPNGVTRVAWDVAFDTNKNNNINLNNNHRVDTNNPHNVTKAQVWLWNVIDEEQLSTTAGDFDKLPQKPDVQLHLGDKYVIQDSSDANIIKSIDHQTQLIWKASLIQDWNPSVNYYVFNFTGSTDYDIRSYVYIGWNLYRCLLQHQSSGSFAADLANGFWQQVTWWGTWGGNILTSGNGSPTTPGVNAWDVYVDLVSWELFYRDGSAWQPAGSTGGYTWDVVVFTWTWAPVTPWVTAGDIYTDNTPGSEAIYVWNWSARVQVAPSWVSGWVNYATSPVTVWDRIVFSQWVSADTINESAISYDDVTWTIDWNWTTQTWTTTFDSWYTANYEWSNINYDGATTQNNSGIVNNEATSVINNNGGDINNTGTTETNTWVTEDYDVTSVTNHDWTQNNSGDINNTNNTITNVGVTEEYDATSVVNNNGNAINNTNNTITNVGVTENYDATSNTTHENLTVENLTVNNPISWPWAPWVWGEVVNSIDTFGSTYPVGTLSTTWSTVLVNHWLWRIPTVAQLRVRLHGASSVFQFAAATGLNATTGVLVNSFDIDLEWWAAQYFIRVLSATSTTLTIECRDASWSSLSLQRAYIIAQ